MSRTRSQSVNDIYNPNLFADDSGIHDDIYRKEGDSDSEYSFDSERESEDTLGSMRPEYSADSVRMPPPPSKSPVEMELRQLTKEQLITKYLELNTTEKELREYNRKIILKNRSLEEDIEDIETLLEKMTKQNAIIEVLQMGKEKLQKEMDQVKINNAVLQKRVSELTQALPRQGGNNKRIKNVSKRSTASHHHATRRHSSKR